MIVTLKSNSTIAKIDSMGAQLISLKDALQTEYIWQRDTKYWGECSPILFPIVSNIRNNKTIIDGVEYTIKKHGFARNSDFKLMYSTDEKAIFSFSFNDETLKCYPYKFNLSITYVLCDTTLTIEYSVLNLDDKKIHFYLGAHPAFNVPLSDDKFEDYCVEFAENQTFDGVVYDAVKSELNVDKHIDVFHNSNRIQLDYSLFDDNTLIFDKLNSRKVKLYNIRTGRGVMMDFSDFDYFAMWTMGEKKAPYLCLEPWAGLPICNDEGDVFENRRGVKSLEIDQQIDLKLEIILL